MLTSDTQQTKKPGTRTYRTRSYRTRSYWWFVGIFVLALLGGGIYYSLKQQTATTPVTANVEEECSRTCMWELVSSYPGYIVEDGNTKPANKPGEDSAMKTGAAQLKNGEPGGKGAGGGTGEATNNAAEASSGVGQTLTVTIQVPVWFCKQQVDKYNMLADKDTVNGKTVENLPEHVNADTFCKTESGTPRGGQ